MIMEPSKQPDGTQFWITRRPDIFWEMCAPCEEVMAGPFDDQEVAFATVRHVRSWAAGDSPIDAQVPFGVLAIRPTARDVPPLTPRYERVNGECVRHESGTRLAAQWIVAHAAERCESLDRHIAPGF